MAMHKAVNMTITTTEPLWPTAVIDEIQRVMEEGQAKGKRDWDKMPATEHLMRAKRHIVLHLKGDVAEDHMAHAFTRLMMAMAIRGGYLEVPHA